MIPLYSALLEFLGTSLSVSAQFGHFLTMKMDRTKTEHLLFDDYITLCMTLHILTAAFRQRDPANTGVIQAGYEDFLITALMPRV